MNILKFIASFAAAGTIFSLYNAITKHSTFYALLACGLASLATSFAIDAIKEEVLKAKDGSKEPKEPKSE
ncbi:MAG: hypothetical protein WCK37_04715 [Candidatus Falkowbacteria bacterium]